MELLSADDARAFLLQKGVTVLPSVKTLKASMFGKIFSGKMPDGSIWKVRKETEDSFTVWIDPAV